MAENPLLPHRRLLELHALMLRCRELDRAQRSPLAREAVLAPVTIQMEPGDLLCGDDGDSTVATLTQAKAARSSSKKKAKTEAPAAPSTKGLSRLTLAAGMAKAMQAAGSKGTVIVLASAGDQDAGWAEALAYAQAAHLPLLLVCVDSGAARRTRADFLHEEAVTRVCRKLFLPTLQVDGEDAVAMYRAMQESFLRARTGDGPAVVWSLLPKRGPRGTSLPIANMTRYLAARGLKPKK